MSKADALAAYRDSLYDAAELERERRIGERSMILGGLWPGLQQFGNALWRPFKIGGAWMFGYGGSEREFPNPPEVPQEFRGTSLEQGFGESWKLKQESTKARIAAMDKLLSFDIPGWWKQASIAGYAEARDTHVAFPEEGMAQDYAVHSSGGGNGNFVSALLSERGSGSSRSVE